MKKAIFFLGLLLATGAFANKTAYPFQVSKTGQGKQAILFIPGFGCSGEVWKETLPSFSADYTCYTFTMAGFAGSPAKDSASFRLWEQELAAFIREEKLLKPVVVGHSMGGVLALALAADFPSVIGKIVVVDGLPCLAALMNPSFSSSENPGCSAMVDQMTALSQEQFYKMQKMSIPQMLADSSRREQVVGWTVQSDRKTFASMYCDFMNTDLRGSLKNIECPALVLLEPGFQAMKASIEGQYKGLRTASLRYATRGLHFIMYDDTNWYNQQLHAFINN